jgi:hypothetical protein
MAGMGETRVCSAFALPRELGTRRFGRGNCGPRFLLSPTIGIAFSATTIRDTLFGNAVPSSASPQELGKKRVYAVDCELGL